MTEEATNRDVLTMLPFRFNIEFLQELSGVVLAESFDDAKEDILEKGILLPQFKLLTLDQLSMEEYKQIQEENNIGQKKETLN